MVLRKKIMIIVLSLILTGGSFFWLFKTRQKKVPIENKPMTAAEIEQKTLAAQANYALIKRAAKEKNPELCDKFSGINRDDCIMNVFKANSSMALCEKIADSRMKDDCKDLDVFYESLRNKDLNGCLKVSNESYKKECLKMLVSEFDSIDDCGEQSGEVKSLCESAVYYKIALGAKKLELCEKIEETAYRADCQKVLKNLSPDQDKDGLTDDHEIQLGTNPFKADSDGDGMNDGEEMKAQRNPLIKGK